MTEEIIMFNKSDVESLEEAIIRLEQENKDLKKEIDDLLEKKPDCNDEFGCQELIELKQENEELKNIIKIQDSTKYDYYKLMKENEEWHIKYAGCNTANSAIQEENKKYRSALEEIREDIKCFYSFEDSSNDYQLVEIIDKINEVLE